MVSIAKPILSCITCNLPQFEKKSLPDWILYLKPLRTWILNFLLKYTIQDQRKTENSEMTNALIFNKVLVKLYFWYLIFPKIGEQVTSKFVWVLRDWQWKYSKNAAFCFSLIPKLLLDPISAERFVWLNTCFAKIHVLLKYALIPRSISSIYIFNVPELLKVWNRTGAFAQKMWIVCIKYNLQLEVEANVQPFWLFFMYILFIFAKWKPLRK